MSNLTRKYKYLVVDECGAILDSFESLKEAEEHVYKVLVYSEANKLWVAEVFTEYEIERKVLSRSLRGNEDNLKIGGSE